MECGPPWKRSSRPRHTNGGIPRNQAFGVGNNPDPLAGCGPSSSCQETHKWGRGGEPDARDGRVGQRSHRGTARKPTAWSRGRNRVRFSKSLDSIAWPTPHRDRHVRRESEPRMAWMVRDCRHHIRVRFAAPRSGTSALQPIPIGVGAAASAPRLGWGDLSVPSAPTRSRWERHSPVSVLRTPRIRTSVAWTGAVSSSLQETPSGNRTLMVQSRRGRRPLLEGCSVSTPSSQGR